jgi:hypothetical protein
VRQVELARGKQQGSVGRDWYEGLGRVHCTP